MSTRPALPKRTDEDKSKRAEPPSATDGFDAYLPVDWVRRTGANVSDALIAWDCNKLVELPVGIAWDVVQLPRVEGWETIRDMQEQGARLGPILHTQAGIEVFVSVGSAAEWQEPGATVKRSGTTIEVPHPAVIVPHTSNARSWIVTPHGTDPVLTNADTLRVSYEAARRACLGWVPR